MKRTSLPLQRRDFITLLGGAAAWPLAARAQPSAMPVIGVINSGTSAANAKNVTALRQALKEAGFVDRESVVIEFRWAENQFDRLPGLVIWALTPGMVGFIADVVM